MSRKRNTRKWESGQISKLANPLDTLVNELPTLPAGVGGHIETCRFWVIWDMTNEESVFKKWVNESASCCPENLTSDQENKN